MAGRLRKSFRDRILQYKRTFEHKPMTRGRVNTSLPNYHWPESVPDVIWAPLASAALLLIVGALALALNQVLLFPSLGPTAYLQSVSPENPTSRIYNVVVGHLAGLGSGFLAIQLLTFASVPPSPAPAGVRVALVSAAVLALALTVFTGLILRASHAPAAATTLLVALGAIKTAQDALHLVAGVLLIAVIGEAIRRIRLGELNRHSR